ncbi:MAG: zinc ribbon domain-containing protein [Candidatus ainarchaeum sp.]|nr:zinc ribbon domain-containing protein [Candidatus ainarchaeum sp.]
MGLLDLLTGKEGGEKGWKAKCPNCGKEITLDVERCPYCGVHVKSMFRKKCPKCGELNELDVERCVKCKYDFAAELARAKKTIYVCPICGYRADYYMLRCPACNTRFS